MEDHRVVSRTIAVVLGLICAASVVGLIITFANHTLIINNKDSIISSQNSEITDLQNQRSQMQTWLNGNKTYYANEISDLQNQRDLAQTWLDGNRTYYANQIGDLQNQKNLAQTWLDGNRTYYANQIADKDSQIASLQAQLNNSNSIANLSEYKIIVSEKTINQGPNSATLLLYLSFPYAGYLHVSSTSTTSDAYVTVQYWFQGELFSSTESVGTSGEKIFPVLKSDAAAIYIGNTNLVNGATHTLTITYHY